MNMFELLRPDAKNALESENVKKALLRYRGILRTVRKEMSCEFCQGRTDPAFAFHF
jgi:hypothetical protein